jgi:hypothetical protein
MAGHGRPYGSTTALRTVTPQKEQSRKRRYQKGPRDVINEEKDEFADDMMVLKFSLVGSLGTASIR